MIILCPSCSTRLQIDDVKAPAKPFSVRCPKCGTSVDSSSRSPASEQSGLALGESPSTERQRFNHARLAPVFELEPTAESPKDDGPADEAVAVLLNLLKKSVPNLRMEEFGETKSGTRRKALVCASEAYRETIARSLTENNYQVFVAEELGQATETMRSDELQVVLLEPQFDPTEQGAAFVVREINVLRANQRRRLFFVLLSPSLRTMDAHAAFLNNANAIVNLADLEDLPHILEVALRDFNELYKDFNSALSLSAL
jgi:predicted Zn finger-like uncharacterized protein